MEKNRYIPIEKPDEHEKKSQYHGGMQYLERIDAILKAIDQTSISFSTDQPTWCGLTCAAWQTKHSLLVVLFKEIYPKLTDKEKKYHNEMQLKAATNFTKGRSEMVNPKISRIDSTFMGIFDKWEKELRELVNAKGLLMPSKQDGIDAAGR